MRFIACAALAGAAALLIASSTLADDSSAAIGVGGVSFAKSDAIRMAAEDLRISPDKVKIHFEFVNDGPRDIDTEVAFPLPDIDMAEYWEVPIGTITNDPVNFVGFKVSVNGNPVAFQSEQKAIFRGRDVTAIVKAAGLPVNVIGASQQMDKLAADKKAALIKSGIAVQDSDYLHPLWTVRTRFHWKQHFPAGRTVIVDHSYQPVTGGTFYTTYDQKDGGRAWKKDYCMDPPTLSRINKMLAAASRASNAEEPDGMLQISSTDYILSTGNNWKGGIGKFHLTLDKLKPQNTLSVCWDGDLKKTSATTFEFTAADYHPTRDVKMVVLK